MRKIPKINPLRNYWIYLRDREPREAFAKRAGYSYDTFRSHLVLDKPRRAPKARSLAKIAKASNGALKLQELIEFFRPGTPTDDLNDWRL